MHEQISEAPIIPEDSEAISLDPEQKRRKVLREAFDSQPVMAFLSKLSTVGARNHLTNEIERLVEWSVKDSYLGGGTEWQKRLDTIVGGNFDSITDSLKRNIKDEQISIDRGGKSAAFWGPIKERDQELLDDFEQALASQTEN